MKKIQGIRGFSDTFGLDVNLWQYVESALSSVSEQYGYGEIRLPYLEQSELFQRSVGVTSDIVQKEMYSFVDKNDHSVSLRPEGTASCVRICIEHNLLYGSNQKFFYLAPMFRRERPQKGRLRQFHQFGIEAFGYPEGWIDVEQQLLLNRIWDALSIPRPILHINYLGNAETRKSYKSALQSFYEPYAKDFDPLSQDRLVKNPLRLLDSKDPVLVDINQSAPAIIDHLSMEEKGQYELILQQLSDHNIDFHQNHALVRGLDYYSGFIYEYTSELLGAQSSVCGGGRYDQLFDQLGGQAVSATGFSIGLERLLSMVDISRQALQYGNTVNWINLEPELISKSMFLCDKIRSACSHVRIENTLSVGKASNMLKKAEKSGAQYAILFGRDEYTTGIFTLKNLQTREQEQLSITDLISKLNKE